MLCLSIIINTEGQLLLPAVDSVSMIVEVNTCRDPPRVPATEAMCRIFMRHSGYSRYMSIQYNNQILYHLIYFKLKHSFLPVLPHELLSVILIPHLKGYIDLAGLAPGSFLCCHQRPLSKPLFAIAIFRFLLVIEKELICVSLFIMLKTCLAVRKS